VTVRQEEKIFVAAIHIKNSLPLLVFLQAHDVKIKRYQKIGAAQ
jgi:hypothetical protein